MALGTNNCAPLIPGGIFGDLENATPLATLDFKDDTQAVVGESRYDWDEVLANEGDYSKTFAPARIISGTGYQANANDQGGKFIGPLAAVTVPTSIIVFTLNITQLLDNDSQCGVEGGWYDNPGYATFPQFGVLTYRDEESLSYFRSDSNVFYPADTITQTGVSKCALKVADNDGAICVNGGTIAVAEDSNVTSAINTFYFGMGGGGSPSRVTIERIDVFSSNVDQQNVTSA